ncbi:prepilin-type N-terminal cleavage/methylation domain-containing protein [Thermosulfurimonas marina]|uniref:Prepilin-type N-terminal cleavage/methylation domain-containing protein n=1 Tax=Thermosulfurimonas marina TaxID=2047767 RepID=A0A6H1WTG3_9BACT|nr:prepilin-type N-terminal cleavage/methylation domain-containing protein [Thermosulfurimonas marina]QJA06515.1 prepilin-type N-terminal cleavage/methylation domain-containing protein [Thermosulfurimonas marina]
MRREAFTLVELMMVVAILAILGAVSFVVYRHYFRAAFEVDPVQVLLSAKLAEEEYYADNGRYACQIEDLSGFNDGSADNKYYLNQDKDPRRRFYVEVSDCPDNGTTGYTLHVKNETTDPQWQIEWELSCNATASLGACKPVQTKGTSIFRSLF